MCRVQSKPQRSVLTVWCVGPSTRADVRQVKRHQTSDWIRGLAPRQWQQSKQHELVACWMISQAADRVREKPQQWQCRSGIRRQWEFRLDDVRRVQSSTKILYRQQYCRTLSPAGGRIVYDLYHLVDHIDTSGRYTIPLISKT